MSDLPPPGEPVPPPSQQPGGEGQPQYAPYYRPSEHQVYGDVERLQALSDGYFGLNMVFLLNIVLAVLLNVVTGAAGQTSSEALLMAWIVSVGVMVVVISAATYPYNKRIAFGKSWPESNALIASILMGLNSALCCGLIGYIVMQQIAANEMKLYGIKASMFGMKKRVEERIREMNSGRPSGPAFYQ